MSNMKSDITIVGGGIIGLCSAFYLSRLGYQVTVIDKKTIGESCAKGNAGYITPSHFIPLSSPGMISKGLLWMFDPESPFYIKLRWDKNLLNWLWQYARNCNHRHVDRVKKLLVDTSMESLDLYEKLSQTLANGFEFKKHGLYIVCSSQSYLKTEISNMQRANELGLKAQLLNQQELSDCEPGIKFKAKGAVYYPEDAHVQPAKLLTRLHQYLKKQGVEFIENVNIDEFKIAGKNISALRSQKNTYAVNQLVLACGAWSTQIAQLLDLNIPIQAGKGYSVTIDNPWQTETPFILAEARVAITPFDKAIRFGGTMEFSGIDLTIKPRRVKGILNSVKRYIPDFDLHSVDTTKAWAGLRPCSPDGLPLIGRITKYSNLVVATGHAMLGLSLAPVTGKMVADTLHNERFVPPKLFDPNRFA